jgi:uncharacterized membrane protein
MDKKREKSKESFLSIVHPISNIHRTSGQKAADYLTRNMGSWKFIIIFLIFLFLWIIFNATWVIFGKKWDPYPFILLNLALSSLTAIQSPIILMSQKREEERNRMRAQYDYAINRKAEKEIEELKKQLNRIEKKIK